MSVYNGTYNEEIFKVVQNKKRTNTNFKGNERNISDINIRTCMEQVVDDQTLETKVFMVQDIYRNNPISCIDRLRKLKKMNVDLISVSDKHYTTVNNIN